MTHWFLDSVWRKARCCSQSDNCIRFCWISLVLTKYGVFLISCKVIWRGNLNHFAPAFLHQSCVTSPSVQIIAKVAAADNWLANQFMLLLLSWCYMSTETIKLIRDGEPRVATLSFTQLLSSVAYAKTQSLLLPCAASADSVGPFWSQSQDQYTKVTVTPRALTKSSNEEANWPQNIENISIWRFHLDVCSNNYTKEILRWGGVGGLIWAIRMRVYLWWSLQNLN